MDMFPVKDFIIGTNIRTILTKSEDAELVNSIKANGVLEPLLACKQAKGARLIAGHRRLAAAVKAGLKEVPVRFVDVKDIAALESVRLAENIIRAELNVMDEAKAYAKLMSEKPEVWEHISKQTMPGKAYYEAIDTVAKATGKDKKHILHVVSLNELDADFQMWLKTGMLSLKHGLMVLSLSPDKRKTVKKAIEDESKYRSMDKQPTIGWLASIIEQKVRRDLKAAIFPLDEAYADRIACTSCPYNTANTAGLFGLQTEDTEPICRNAKCFKAKTDQHWRVIRDEFQKKAGDVPFVGYINDGVGQVSSFFGFVLKPAKKKEAPAGWALIKDLKKPKAIYLFKPKDGVAVEGETFDNEKHLRRQFNSIVLRDAFMEKAMSEVLDGKKVLFKDPLIALLRVAPDFDECRKVVLKDKKMTMDAATPEQICQIVTLYIMEKTIIDGDTEELAELCGEDVVKSIAKDMDKVWEDNKVELLANKEKKDSYTQMRDLSKKVFKVKAK